MYPALSNPAMKRSFNATRAASSIALDAVSVASPCHADWDAMRGDERARFCPSCAKNVYNLSAMTGAEAQSLIAEKEGELCIRFFQREDGTMLTRDCPVGAAAWKEKSPAFALWAGVMSLVVLLVAATSPALLSPANAQPETKAQETPLTTETPTSTPPATPSATTVAPFTPNALTEVRGEFAVAPSPTPAPTANPNFRTSMGDYAGPLSSPMRTGEIAPPPTATPKPTPHPPLVMGRMIRPRQLRKPIKPKPKRGLSGAQS